MREDLIAYALGELNEEECLHMEQALAGDELLREELRQVKECLGNDDCPEVELEGEVPTGLADRTTAGILSGCWSESDDLPETPSPSFSAAACWMSPVDMTVALGVLITIGSLLMPALYSSRNQSQRISCSQNMSELGKLLTMYSEENRGFFPVVRPTEHAGIFAPRLREAEFVQSDRLDQWLVCGASPLAEQLAEQGRQFHVPSMAELTLSRGMWRVELRRASSGSYGYQVGYIKGKYYLPVRNRRNSLVPVLSDAPSRVSNNSVTANHGGTVINTLFQDGSVHTLAAPRIPCANDLLYFNNQGKPAASTHWNDAVVLPSGSTPGVESQPMPEAVYRIFFRVQ